MSGRSFAEKVYGANSHRCSTCCGARRTVRRSRQTIATIDHSIPTLPPHMRVEEPTARRQIELLEQNCGEFGIRLLGRGHRDRGIVHMIGPNSGSPSPG